MALFVCIPICPHCGSHQVTVRKGKGSGYFRCQKCSKEFKEFTVRTETIFERSHIPLNEWIFAIYMVLTARKGMSLNAVGSGNRDHTKISLVYATTHS